MTEKLLTDRNLAHLERLMAAMVSLYVFLNPFPQVSSIREICFYSSLGILLFLVYTGRRKFLWSSPLSLPFLFLVVWSVAGIPLALDPANSLHDVLEHLLKYLALYYVLINLFASREQLDRLILLLTLSVGLFSLAGIGLFYGVLGFPFSERFNTNINPIRFAGMSANYMGFAAVPVVLLSIHQLLCQAKTAAGRAVLILCLVATFSATILTQTRGAVIALVASLIILLLKNRKLLLTVLASFAALAVVVYNTPQYASRFTPQGFLGNERISMIHMFLEMVKERPMAGIGFGMEILQRQDYMKQYYDRVPESYRDSGFHVSPHNLYIDVLVRLGVVGLLLYLAIVVIAFAMALQSVRRARDSIGRSYGLCMLAAWIALLIQAFFADASFGVPAVMFYLQLAMITILWKSAQSAEGASVAGRRLPMNRQGGGMMPWRRVTKEQTALIAVLREEVLALPDIDRNGESGAETAWAANRRELRRNSSRTTPCGFWAGTW